MVATNEETYPIEVTIANLEEGILRGVRAGQQTGFLGDHKMVDDAYKAVVDWKNRYAMK